MIIHNWQRSELVMIPSNPLAQCYPHCLSHKIEVNYGFMFKMVKIVISFNQIVLNTSERNIPGRVGVADPEPDLLPPCGELLPPLPPPEPDPASEILAPRADPLAPLPEGVFVPDITGIVPKYEFCKLKSIRSKFRIVE